MIAIHYQGGGNFYSTRWRFYCEENNIPHKLVSCYDNDIMEQLEDCDALVWHVDNYDSRDQLLAKNLINALENRQIKLYPNSKTLWHYDDKVAQKYLFESVGAPLVKSFAFYNQSDALEWAKSTTFPKVFKLTRGAGSVNVKLVKSNIQADRLIRKAFSKGFPVLDMKQTFKERYRKFKIGQESLLGLLKGFLRLFIATPYVNRSSKEKGYAYFQEFLPNNFFDQRIMVTGHRAIAGKRMTRENDFRASGSGEISWDRREVDKNCIGIAFEVSKKLGLQSAAYDFIYDQNGKPKIIEVSFCADPNRKAFPTLKGYWTSDLEWHSCDKDLYYEEWILEDLLKEIY